MAAVFPQHPFHASAQAATAAATAAQPAVFCRATQISFLRLITTPQLLRHYDAEHMTNAAALVELQMLLARPEITEIDEPSGTAALWHQLAARDTASPKVWMDAYLAAFAISGKLRLVSLDKDFTIFESRGLHLSLLRMPA
ncbi:MAG: TA system VapC family ribonuclease toxin [Oceanipulchritudo sp.]